MVGRGLVMMLLEGRVFILRAFFHALENLTLQCVGVGLMG